MNPTALNLHKQNGVLPDSYDTYLIIVFLPEVGPLIY